MMRKERSRRRKDSLSRDSIIKASIEILDTVGESGLTFRALSERLATGAGAIYWHIDNKSDLMTAACDAVVATAVSAASTGKTPQDTIRSLALGMFDAIDDHPWIGSALYSSAAEMPVVRIVEGIGREIDALGVPERKRWSAVSALLSYILGVGGQNASNAQMARAEGLDRTVFLTEVSEAWSRLDADEFPFVRSIAPTMGAHDDREDFLAGIDFILRGMLGE